MRSRFLCIVALAVVLVLSAATSVFSKDVRVRGYHRKDGTYVQPHYRTSPNSTKLDNWSTKGNVNPYTGKPGTKDPYPTSRQSPTTPGTTYQPYIYPVPLQPQPKAAR